MCEHASGRDVVAPNILAAGFTDGSPLTPGRTLIVPRSHEPDFLALSSGQQAAICALVPEVCGHIEAHGHAHLDIIPRYRGSVEDPRGGIRWITPGKARYWEGE